MAARTALHGAPDGRQGMAVDRVLSLRTPGRLIPLPLPLPQGRGFQIAGLLPAHGPVPRHLQIFRQHIRQPQQVVGDPGPDPRPMGRMPPVLHVSLRKLAGGGQHQLFPGPLRHSEQQGPHVLELVPEAVGSAILILRRAGHQPAGQHLIERPAVEIPVQRRLRGGEAQGGHLFPPVQHDLLPLCLRPFRREGVPAVDQPAPFPRRAHQDGRQSLRHRAGGRLSILWMDSVPAPPESAKRSTRSGRSGGTCPSVTSRVSPNRFSQRAKPGP